MRRRYCYSFLRLFSLEIFFFSNSREVTAKVISPQFLTCLVKFKTSYMIRTAWRTAARNPGEITISLAFVCGEPSCIQKHSSPLRFLSLLYCTSICMQRGPLGLSPPGIHPGQWSIYDARFCFLICHSSPFQFISSQSRRHHVKV